MRRTVLVRTMSSRKKNVSIPGLVEHSVIASRARYRVVLARVHVQPRISSPIKALPYRHHLVTHCIRQLLHRAARSLRITLSSRGSRRPSLAGLAAARQEQAQTAACLMNAAL